MIMVSVDQEFRQGTPWKACLCSVLFEALNERCKGRGAHLLICLIVDAGSLQGASFPLHLNPSRWSTVQASVSFFTAWWLVSPKVSIPRGMESQVEAVFFLQPYPRSHEHFFCHTLVGVVTSPHPDTREGNTGPAFG